MTRPVIRMMNSINPLLGALVNFARRQHKITYSIIKNTAMLFSRALSARGVFRLQADDSKPEMLNRLPRRDQHPKKGILLLLAQLEFCSDRDCNKGCFEVVSSRKISPSADCVTSLPFSPWW